MTWPRCLPAEWQADGVIMDARSCMTELPSYIQPQGGPAVLFDMDGTEGTYASAEQQAVADLLSAASASSRLVN